MFKHHIVGVVAVDEELVNRTIQVAGVAKRTKISFIVGGKATEKYCYQTHVRVDSASQITLVEAGA